VAAEQRTRATWGLNDVVLWFLVAQVAAMVGGGLVLQAAGYAPGDVFPLWLVALLQIPLWLGYLAGPLIVSRRKGEGPVAELGARIRAGDLVPGLALGVAAQLVAVPLLYHLVVLRLVDGDLSAPARDLVDRAVDPVGVVLLVLIAGIGAPLVEELFYRGFLLRALQRRMTAPQAVVVSSIVFAAVHFQALQFPALLLFGLLAGWLTVRTGRLGMAWAAHVAFNLVTITILLLS
jgi:uncharacterized protein